MSEAEKTDEKVSEKLPFIQRLVLFIILQALMVGLPLLLIVWLADHENTLTIILRWLIGIWVVYGFTDGLISLVGGASETKAWRLSHNMQIWILALVLNVPLQVVVAFLATR